MPGTLSPVLTDFTQTFDHATYQYTTSVNHNGKIIAFAMDADRRIYYSILDLEENPAPVDARNWKDPRQLRFPNEITQVGYGVVPPVQLPAVKAVFQDSTKEAAKFDPAKNTEIPADQLEEKERSEYWSSTGRLTGNAPIQALSDQKYIYVFRQAISAGNAAQLFIQADGTVSATVPQTANKKAIPLVNQTLLVDRFVLARKSDPQQPNSPVEWRLESKLEVRYRRSRNKTRPQSAKDSLGAKDMEGKPFYEPTAELTFVDKLTSGRFAVLLLPTSTPELNRWQIFSYDSDKKVLHSFNLECSRDGLFNTAGTQLYTSPDPQYRDAVLERQPGVCPFTKQPLVPLGDGGGLEQTSIALTSGANPIGLKSGIAARLFYQQEIAATGPQHNPLKKPLKRAGRVLLAAVTTDNQIVTLDFPVTQAGKLSTRTSLDLKAPLPAPTPAAAQELLPVAQDKALSLITYGGLLNVQASADLAATPQLFDSATGKIALYYQGKPDEKVYVFHYDTQAARGQTLLNTRYDFVIGKLGQELGAGQNIASLPLEKSVGGESLLGKTLRLGKELFNVSSSPANGAIAIKVTPRKLSQALPAGTPVTLVGGGVPAPNAKPEEQAKTTLTLLARSTGKWANDAIIKIADEANPDFCTVTIQTGGQVETYKRVPRAVQQFADVLNGQATGKTYLGQAVIGDDELLNGITNLKLTDRKGSVAAGDRVQLGDKGRFTAGGMTIDGQSADIIHNASSLTVNVALAEAGTFVYLEKEYVDSLYECSFQPGAPEVTIMLAMLMNDRNNVATGDQLALEIALDHRVAAPEQARRLAQFEVLKRNAITTEGRIQFACKSAVLLAAGTPLLTGADGQYLGTLARDYTHSETVIHLNKDTLSVLSRDLLKQSDALTLSAGPWTLVCDPGHKRETAGDIELPVQSANLGGDASVYRTLAAPRLIGRLKRDWALQRNSDLNLSGAIELADGIDGLREFDVLLLGNYRLLFNEYVVPGDGLQPTTFVPVYQTMSFTLPAYRLDYDYGFYFRRDSLQHDRAIVFNGAKPVPVPSLTCDLKDGLTLECWVYLDKAAPWTTLLNLGCGTDYSNSITLGCAANPTQIAFYLGNAAGQRCGWLSKATDVLPLNRWVHLAVVVPASGAPQLYVDDRKRTLLKAPFDKKTPVIEATEVLSDGLQTRATNYLGYLDKYHLLGNKEVFFTGQLDEVRLWSRACAAAEIQQNLNRNLIYGEPGLEACWRTDDGSDQIRNGALPRSNDPQASTVISAQPGLAEGAVQNVTAVKLAGGATCKWTASAPAARVRMEPNFELHSLENAPYLPDNDLTIETWCNLAVPDQRVLSFDGQQQYLELAGSANQTHAHPNGLSIELWAYFDSLDAPTALLAWYDSKQSARNQILLGNSGESCKRISLYLSNSLGDWYGWQSNDDVVLLKQWMHVAVTVAVDGTAALYINGKAKALGIDKKYNGNWAKWLDTKGAFLSPAAETKGDHWPPHINTLDKVFAFIKRNEEAKGALLSRDRLRLGSNAPSNQNPFQWRNFHGELRDCCLWAEIRAQAQIQKDMENPPSIGHTTDEADATNYVAVDLVEQGGTIAAVKDGWQFTPIKLRDTIAGTNAPSVSAMNPAGAMPIVSARLNDNQQYSLGISQHHKLTAQYGTRKIKAAVSLPRDGGNFPWAHVAAVYQQAYALQFDGKADTYLDCGNDRELDISGDLTLEVFLQVDKDASGAQTLVSKGRIGSGQTVPYALSLDADLRLVFECEDKRGKLWRCKSDASVPKDKPVIVAITRRRQSFSTMKKNGDHIEVETTSEFYDVRFYITQRAAGSKDAGQPPLLPVTPALNGDWDRYKNHNLAWLDEEKRVSADSMDWLIPASALTANGASNLARAFDRRAFLTRPDINHVTKKLTDHEGEDVYRELGNNGQEVFAGRGFKGVIGELRVWDRALPEEEIGRRNVTSQSSGLTAWWRFEERLGRVAYDSKGESHARLRGPKWIKDPDKQASSFKLYQNGVEVSANDTSPDAPDSRKGLNVGGNNFSGELAELRIWNLARAQAQLRDNLFSPLRSDTKDLLAYYTFENDSARLLKPGDDHGPRGIHLLNTAHTAGSTVPISDELPLVSSGCLNPDYQVKLTPPAVQEYASLQLDGAGKLTGAYKRCYSFIQDNKWLLATGYNAGNVVTEWMGQVQSNPQVIGFIEGAPPVPGENLTNPARNTTKPKDYTGVTAVEFGGANIVKYIYSASRDTGFDMQVDAKAQVGVASRTEGGFGLVADLAQAKVLPGIRASFVLGLSDTEQSIQTRGFNQAERLRVELRGAWEQNDPARYLNPALGRRFIPANTGLALVESDTLDLFAVRLEHNHALVAYQLAPNPDVPRDRNLIPFPINPFYTKQGTLDGKLGCKEDGSLQCDPDYPMAATYGEYSYYKPKEAYNLKKRIQRDRKELETYYNQYKLPTSPDSPSVPGASAFSTRNLADTYIWTAERGFFTDTTTTMEVMHYAHKSRYYFQGRAGLNLKAGFNIGAPAVSFELDTLFGGHVEHIRTKDKDDEQDYSLVLEAKGETDIQLYANTDTERAKYAWQNEFGGVYDEHGQAVNRPGKVDAYRFMTFWLAPSKDNFEDLTGKVIDPVWLNQSASPYAQALRQATQTDGGCWRLLHRVTFVSRIHADFENAAPLEKAARKLDIKSNWELIQKLKQENIESKRGDQFAFREAVRAAIQSQLPELAPFTEQITAFMCDYYEVFDE